MLTIGLTGGIGSGKSEASRYFKALGIKVINSDEIAKSLVAPGKPAYDEIVKKLGKNFVKKDKTLNRGKLRTLIFRQVNYKMWLERLLHPQIRDEILKQIYHAQSPYVVVEIPLLFESFIDFSFVDRILVVDTTKENQIARTQMHHNMSIADVEHVIANQCSREERLERADDIIENNTTFDNLHEAVLSLHQEYLKLSAS
ncbi:MAG: dephospho-CoA kinase [Gammaproteobacteria bacterium]